MNEKEIRALIREAEAAAKKYKAQLEAKTKTPKTKTPATPKVKPQMKPVPSRGGSMGVRRPRGGGSAGGLGINDMNR